MPARVLLRAVVALLCVAGVAVSVISRQSRIEGEDTFRYYFATKDERGTLDRLNDSRTLNPNYQLDIAKARLSGRGGLGILQEAVRREPENAELWLRLSQQQNAAGDRAGAKRSYARARMLAPRFLPPDGPPPGI